MRCSNSEEFRRVCSEAITRHQINKVIVLFDDTLSITKTLREISKNVSIEVIDLIGKIEWKKTPEKVRILNNIINTYWQGRELNEPNERAEFIRDEEYNEDDLNEVYETVETFIPTLGTFPDNHFVKKWVNGLIRSEKLKMPVKTFKEPVNVPENIKFVNSKDEFIQGMNAKTLIIVNETHEHFPGSFFSDLVKWIYSQNQKVIILEKDQNQINLFNLFSITANDISKTCYASINHKNKGLKEIINLNVLCLNLK